MSSAPTIAILGAGYIGHALARSLAADGAVVYAVRRSPRPPEPGITWIAADLSADLTDAPLPSVLDAVVLTIAPTSMADGYERTYPPAAAQAIALARRTGATSLIYTSSTGVYGGVDGALTDESSPRRGTGPGNQALIAAEDLLLASGLTGVTVLRVAGIYGPGRDPRGRFLDATRLPMHGEYWVNQAQRDDIVAAIRHRMAWRGPAQALNCADSSPTLAADIARWMAAARGIDPATLQFGNAAERSRSNQRIDSAALQATGWSPRFPSFREGFTGGL